MHVVLVLFLIAFLSLPLHAQENALPSVTGEGVEISTDGDRAFSQASDEQIAEAQRFYRRCANNETLSAQKDCKCAAAAYLETRMVLGASASVDDIMKKNINTCLKDPKYSAVEGEAPDLSGVTDKQMDEAEAMFAECKGSLKLSRRFDCECYASRFLSERIKQGPTAQKEQILLSFENECRNVLDSTGHEYTGCMGNPMYYPENVEPKDFCECYARRWAKLYESYPGKINRFTTKNIRMRARAQCQNP